jgi:hypothetical protein
MKRYTPILVREEHRKKVERFIGELEAESVDADGDCR